MKVWYHDGAIFITPVYASAKEAEAWLKQAGQEAKKAMDEAGADHAVYGTKSYDPESGDLIEVDIYNPAVLLNDAEFDRRIASYQEDRPRDMILAYHRLRKPSW